MEDESLRKDEGVACSPGVREEYDQNKDEGGEQSCAGAQERGSAYGRMSCAYQSAGAEYVRRHAGGGENRAQPQERGGGFRHTGQNRPTPDPGTGARLVALGGGCTIGWRAKRGFNSTRCAGEHDEEQKR